MTGALRKHYLNICTIHWYIRDEAALGASEGKAFAIGNDCAHGFGLESFLRSVVAAVSAAARRAPDHPLYICTI